MFGYDTLFNNLPMMKLVFEENQLENDMIPTAISDVARYENLSEIDIDMDMTKKASFRLAGTFYAYWHPISAFAKSNLLYLHSLGINNASTPYYTRRKDLNSYLIKYTLSGCGKLVYEDKEYLVPEGTGFLIDCRKYHLYKTQGENWLHAELHMRGAYLDQLYDLFHQNGGVLFKPSDVNQFLFRVDELFRTDCSIDSLREIRVSALLNNLLIELLSGEESYKTEMGRIPPQLQPLVRYLEQNYTDSFSLDELSEFCGLSKHHMCRVFRKFTGFTIMEYQTDLRISKAKDLLQTTNLSVAEVGYMVGIYDVNYFYRLFKKKTGISPGKYARGKRRV